MPSFSQIATSARSASSGAGASPEVKKLAGLVEQLASKCNELENKLRVVDQKATRATLKR